MITKRRGQLYLRDNKLGSVNVGSMWDIDATHFIVRAGLKGIYAIAINELVWELKQANLWDSIKVLYPFICVDITNANALLNLKNINTSGSFSGGSVTYAKTGITPSSVGLNTGFAGTSLASQMSHHLAYYSRTNNAAANNYLMGASSAPPVNINPRFSLITNATNVASYDHANVPSVNVAHGSDTTGFFIASRISSTDIRMYRNGSQLGATFTTPASGNLSSSSVFIFAANNGVGTAQAPTNKECAFASIGDGLTTAQVEEYNRIVQNYQQRLGRAV